MGLLPPVISILEADITGFVSKMNTATQKMDAVDQLSVGVSKRQVQATAMGLMAVGALATGAGAVLLSVSEPIEKAQATLRQVIENTGRSWDDYKAKVDAAVNSETHFGKGSADTQEALGKLTAAYQDPERALKELNLVTEIAAYKHISLADAAAIDVRMHAGAAKTFKEFGINVADEKKLLNESEQATKAHNTATAGLTKAQQALSDLEARDAGKKKLTIADEQALTRAHEAVAVAQGRVNTTATAASAATAAAAGATKNYDAIMQSQLLPRLKGVAEAQAETFGGKLDEYRTRIMNMAGAVGKNLGPALTMIGPLLMGVGGAMQFFTMVTWTGVAAVWAFLWPILAVIAVIAVLAAGLIYTYTHVKWFRDAVNFAWKEIQILWGWLSQNFVPIISVVGRVIGDLVGQQLKNFVNNMTVLGNVVGALWNGLAGFAGFLGSTFKAALSAVTGPIQAVGTALQAINPFARHSPSLVDNVEAGVAKIKGHYMSLSGMNLAGPSLGGISAGSTAMGLGGFAMAGVGGGGGVNVTVVVQGNVLNWNDTAQQLAEPIRAALLQKKRSLGTLGLA